MTKNWKVKIKNTQKAEVFSLKLRKEIGDVILSILYHRGLKTDQEVERFFFFDYERDVVDPFLFSDMEKAVSRIREALEKQEKVTVFGDYDADGVTATALIEEVLKNIGIEQVTSYIPNRQTEGYGLNEKAIEYLKEQGVSLIVTVDCGITGKDEIEKARKLGIDVVITDHHNIPPVLPEAVAIINPKVPGSKYPQKDLAGVGIAFKLAQAIYKKIDPEKIDQLKWGLDLVAAGTIADCVPLLGENRVLAKYGMLVLSKTKRVGFQEMFKVAGIDFKEGKMFTSEQITFQIAPRINASGRMDHASVSLALLQEEDRVKARDMALEVEKKNQSRQKVTGEIVREVKILAENSFKDKSFILAHNPHWPVGVLGLVAGKITDEHQKPSIILQDQGETLVGSSRSIPEFDIMKALGKCRNLFIKFGGHSQAAGFSIKKENLEKFYAEFSQISEKSLAGFDFMPKMTADMLIDFDQIDWDLINFLGKMEPFGERNPEPIFWSQEVVVEEVKIVGNGNKHLKMFLHQKGGSPRVFDAIAFGFGKQFPELKKNDIINIVFKVRKDEWNGNQKIQLNILDMETGNPNN